MFFSATISLNDNDPAGGRSTLRCCARSRPPERAQVLPSSQLQIHRPSLILPFFPFPSHPPSLNQASLCFQIGLSFSLGARSLAVGSCGRSSDGLALISRIVLSLDPLCAFSFYFRKKKTLIGIQHRALIPRVHHRSIGFGGRRILDILILTVGLREASSLIKAHLGTEAQNIICVFYSHTDTLSRELRSILRSYSPMLLSTSGADYYSSAL